MGEKLVERDCELCGRPVLVQCRAIRRGWGRFHRRCAQIARTMGAKNPNYQGGRAYHSTRISRQRRSRIKARDGSRCVHCGRAGKELDPKDGVQLDVHHVVAVRDGGPDDDANLVTLCRRCHNRIERGQEVLAKRGKVDLASEVLAVKCPEAPLAQPLSAPSPNCRPR